MGMRLFILAFLCIAAAHAAETADTSAVQESSVPTTNKVAAVAVDRDYLDFSNMLIPVTHEARLGSPYGIRNHRLHRGVDVKIIRDEPIVAALPGVVIMSKYNPGGYGHYVLVQHDNDIQTLNWSLTEDASHISKSDVITAHRKMQWRLKKEEYVVKKGDTLESIAAWFNISVKALCRINNISPESPLRIGQRLRGSGQ